MAGTQSDKLAMLGFCVATFMASTSLVGGYVTIQLTPINQSINDLKLTQKEDKVTLAPLLTLYAQHTSDLEKFISLQKQIDDRLETKVFDTSHVAGDKSRDEILHQIHDLEGKIVSREENTIHWGIVDALTLRVTALDARCPGASKP